MIFCDIKSNKLLQQITPYKKNINTLLPAEKQFDIYQIILYTESHIAGTYCIIDIIKQLNDFNCNKNKLFLIFKNEEETWRLYIWQEDAFGAQKNIFL